MANKIIHGLSGLLARDNGDGSFTLITADGGPAAPGVNYFTLTCSSSGQPFIGPGTDANGWIDTQEYELAAVSFTQVADNVNDRVTLQGSPVASATNAYTPGFEDATGVGASSEGSGTIVPNLTVTKRVPMSARFFRLLGTTIAGPTTAILTLKNGNPMRAVEQGVGNPSAPWTFRYTRVTPVQGSASGVAVYSSFPIDFQDARDATGVIIHFIAAGAGNTAQAEWSEDNTNWFAAKVVFVSNGINAHTPGNGSITPVAGEAWWTPKMGRYFRLRTSNQVGGTDTAIVGFDNAAAGIMVVDQGEGSNNRTWKMTPVWSSSQSPVGTQSKVKTAATTNATNLKASAGKIHSLTLCNNTAAAKYIKFYDKASTPNPASDTVKFTLIIPANTVAAMIQRTWEGGIPFPTGVSYAITGAIGETDTTVTAVDDVVGEITWI